MTEADRLANALATAIKQTDLEDDVIHVARWFVEDSAALLRQQAAEIERLKEAIQQAGLTLAKTQQGYQLLKLGKIEAQSATKQEQAEPVGYVDDYNSCGYYVANTPTNTYKTLKPVFRTAPQGQTTTDKDSLTVALLKQALEALEPHKSVALRWYTPVDAAIAAIKQHLGEA